MCNLFIPEEPETFTLATPAGTWEFRRLPGYLERKDDILCHSMCGMTYEAYKTVDIVGSRSAALEESLNELLPLCLGASYLVLVRKFPTV